MNNSLKSILAVIEQDENGDPTPESLQVARETAKNTIGVNGVLKEIDELEMEMYRKKAEENNG